MAMYRCELCGEPIRQKDEMIRTVVERVNKKKGDSKDPEEWQNVIDWSACFLAHARCTQEEVAYREQLVEIPGENHILSLFEETQDETDKPDLKLVR
jgi:hypothetical protein